VAACAKIHGNGYGLTGPLLIEYVKITRCESRTLAASRPDVILSPGGRADMKRLLSIPMILCVLVLSACATPQANTEGQFGTIASDAGQPAPGIGTAVSGTSAMVESDTPGTPALDAEAAKSNARVLVSSDLGPPLQGGPEANQQEP